MAALVPDQDLSGAVWGGTYDGPGGNFVGNPLYTGVNVNDDNTSYDAIINDPTQQTFSLNGSVTPGMVWEIQVRIRTFSSVLDVGTLTFRLTDSAGNSFDATPVSIVGLGGTWTTYTFQIDASGTPVTTYTPDSVRCGLFGSIGGVPLHILCTFISVDLASEDFPISAGASATMTGSADVARTLVTTSGTGTGEVVFVDEFTVDFVPGGGSNIVSVILDGVDAGAITTYTFATPALDHLIAVVFDAAVNCATSYTYGTLPGEGMNRESLGGPNPVSSRNEKRLGFVAKPRNFYFPSGEGPA